jgi:hypothetical protein
MIMAPLQAFDFSIRIFCAIFVSNIIDGQSLLRTSLLALGFIFPSIAKFFGLNSAGALITISGFFSIICDYVFFNGPSAFLNLFWLTSSEIYISMNIHYCALFFISLIFQIFLLKIKKKF